MGILGRVEPSAVIWERAPHMGESWRAHIDDEPGWFPAHVIAYTGTVWLFDGAHRRLSEHATVTAAIEAGTEWIVADRRRNGTLQQQRAARRRTEADERWRSRYGIGDPEVVRDHGWDQQVEPDPDGRRDDW